jgi:hypothetical protein
MARLCDVCKVEFKNEDAVILYSDELTHEDCFGGNPGLVEVSGTYEEVAENYLDEEVVS